MSTALVNENNIQVRVIKSIVTDLEWFDNDKTKFEDWWREIRLFFKINRVIETDNRITVVLAYLRGNITSIYAQKKLDKLDKVTEI